MAHLIKSCAAILILSISACSEQKTQNHSEQLPPPGFQTKPQIYMVFDPSLSPFNLPNPEALSAQLNAHVEVFQSSDPAAQIAKIKEYNARPSDLVLIGPRKVPPLESLSLIQHPKRKLSLVLNTTPKISWDPKGQDSYVHLDMEGLENSLEGLRMATKRIGLGEEAVGWKMGQNQEAILVQINWKLWLEQALKSISSNNGSSPYDGKVWKEMSFDGNTLEIRINNPNGGLEAKTLEAIERVVKDFRLSQLGPGTAGFSE